MTVNPEQEPLLLIKKATHRIQKVRDRASDLLERTPPEVLHPAGYVGGKLIGQHNMIGLISYFLTELISDYIPGVNIETEIMSYSEEKDGVVYMIQAVGILRPPIEFRAKIEATQRISGLITEKVEILEMKRVKDGIMRDTWHIKVKVYK